MMKKRKGNSTFPHKLLSQLVVLGEGAQRLEELPFLCYSARAQSFPILQQWLFPQGFYFSLKY